ncbi:MAG: amidohydrolase family protein [Hyphomicrobiales bacterium]|nr:amidohydrolase family protein [Hyphomicrobiales bacterium]
MAEETDLHRFIQTAPMCSTHEHTEYESGYTANPPDVLNNLFNNYVEADLVVAGASPDAVKVLFDRTNPNIRARFAGNEEAWQRVRHTGYGEAVGVIASELYGIEEISSETIEAAQRLDPYPGGPGDRLKLLKDVANLDHVQIDHMARRVPAESYGQDFFLYDIGVCRLCDGTPDLERLSTETGIEIDSLPRLHEAMAEVFAQNADLAVAVKSQHAYHRTLLWQKRSDEDAEKAFEIWRAKGVATPHEDRLCLGDWCWGKLVELTIEHDLPFKLHTGYYAGYGTMKIDRIQSGHLCSLLEAYPAARFTLMHIAYPYHDELIAIAKHFPNVSLDLCWSWAIHPMVTADFVRQFIHAVPYNKLFVFGGDSFWPAATVGYALQTRTWLTRALQQEIDDGLMSEATAIALARNLMMNNQTDYFDLEVKKRNVRSAEAGEPPANHRLKASLQDASSIWANDHLVHGPWR